MDNKTKNIIYIIIILLIVIGLGLGGFFLYQKEKRSTPTPTPTQTPKPTKTPTPTATPTPTKNPSPTPSPTGPTGPPSPPQACVNGSISDGKGGCICPLGYTGTFCENVFCYNGGTPSGNGCNCPQGWGGNFCEVIQCSSGSPTYTCALDINDQNSCVSEGYIWTNGFNSSLPGSPTGCKCIIATCTCPQGSFGDRCQCNVNNLPQMVNSWYCNGKFPVCNEDGSIVESNRSVTSCGELSQKWSSIDISSYDCCSLKNPCSNDEFCFNDCSTTNAQVSLTTCGCPAKPNQIQCNAGEGCVSGQACGCDSTTNYQWKCLPLGQGSQCPPLAKELVKYCKTAYGTDVQPQCVQCGPNGGYVWVCPGTSPGTGYLQCVGLDSRQIEVWDPITNGPKGTTIPISFDTSNGLPIYPTNNNNCNPTDDTFGSSILSNALGGVTNIYKTVNNPSGVYVSNNQGNYFVPLPEELNNEMKGFFYHKYSCPGSTDLCSGCKQPQLYRPYGQQGPNSNISQLCWSDLSSVKCQDRGLINQIIYDNKKGNYDTLYNYTTATLDPSSFSGNLNNSYNYDPLPVDKNDKSNFVQLLPFVGCNYSDYDTDLGLGDNRSDYCIPSYSTPKLEERKEKKKKLFEL